MSEAQKILDQLHTLDGQWKAAIAEQAANVKQHGAELSETREKIERMEAAMAEREAELKQQLRDIEARANTPQLDPGGVKPEQREHVKAFERWVRTAKMGEKFGDAQAEAELSAIERKAVSIGTAAAGGHAVPEVISRMIDQKLMDISVMLPLVKVVNVGSSDYKELVDTRGSSGGWVGETGTRSETNTPNLEQVAPTFGIVYAYPKATEESLQDIFFDVQSWLVNAAADDFDQLIGAAIISGNGTNKPTGFLTGSPNTINDDGASPERAFGTIQYVPTGKAGAFRNGPFDSPVGYQQSDCLVDIVYKLKAGYRRNARWLMNKSTLNVIRKFKDVDAQFIWQRGLTLGQPDTILGYAVSEMEDMPNIGSNTFPIAFGDFQAAYVFCNRVGTSMTIDDNITTPGYVKFYIRRRVGGKLRNDDAIKVIKCAAS